MYKLIVRFIPKEYGGDFQKYVYLPGFCIFSNLEEGNIKNEKIKADILKKKYEKFPKDSEGQNDLWYKIYRAHEDSPRIYPNYRYWLLLRDMVTLNIFLTISITLFSIWGTLSFSSIWTGFMIIQIILEILACRRYCNRYVQYVLVEETYAIEKNRDSPTFVMNNTNNFYF